MNKEFDYVAFAKDFEATNGRPPTSDELDNAYWEHFGIKWHTPEESQVELERINASYKPSLGEHLKDALSFLGRGFFKALLFLIKSPIYLTLFFFNMIKSAIAVVVMFIVTKGIVGVIIAEILDAKNISNLSAAPATLRFFAQDFMTNSLEPIYVTGVDIVICIIFMFLFATVMTFSSAEE